MGGLFGGHTDLLTGAPGAVVFYAVLGIAAWPVRTTRGLRSDLPLPRWVVPAWAVMWLLAGSGSASLLHRYHPCPGND